MIHFSAYHYLLEPLLLCKVGMVSRIPQASFSKLVSRGRDQVVHYGT